MLCIPIKGPSIEEAYQQISQALSYADLVELYLDSFSQRDLNSLKKLRANFSIPMIFTLRSRQQGSRDTQSEEERLEEMRKLASLKPEYLDIEYHVPTEFVKAIASQYPGIRLILSYHDFEKTPQDLTRIYEEMKKTPSFFYKIAVTAQNSLDLLRLLCWKKASQDNKLIAISMGTYGEPSRILAPVVESPITYASIGDSLQTAPGQLKATTLIERYHYRSLNSHTHIYGLIGNPVSLSLSDETHNHFMEKYGLNAVYVKISITSAELPEFLSLAKQLPFHGLSVTMPLKECLAPHIDSIDPKAKEIGAINTLVFEKGKITGWNTDAMGALNAIENLEYVRGKRIVLIGAGGASKAIAYEAHRRGGHITILNRDENKAIQMAQKYHCVGQGLEHMVTYAQEGYDIIINCTPISLPILPEHILSNAIVMDIKTRPRETEFVKQALNKGCSIVYGYQMFIEQALGQFQLWFGESIEIKQIRSLLQQKISTLL